MSDVKDGYRTYIFEGSFEVKDAPKNDPVLSGKDNAYSWLLYLHLQLVYLGSRGPHPAQDPHEARAKLNSLQTRVYGIEDGEGQSLYPIEEGSLSSKHKRGSSSPDDETSAAPTSKKNDSNNGTVLHRESVRMYYTHVLYGDSWCLLPESHKFPPYSSPRLSTGSLEMIAEGVGIGQDMTGRFYHKT
jgi:hypothetical protein